MHFAIDFIKKVCYNKSVMDDDGCFCWACVLFMTYVHLLSFICILEWVAALGSAATHSTLTKRKGLRFLSGDLIICSMTKQKN